MIYSVHTETFSSKRQWVPAVPPNFAFLGGQQKKFFGAKAPTPSPSNFGRSLRHCSLPLLIPELTGSDPTIVWALYLILFIPCRIDYPKKSMCGHWGYTYSCLIGYLTICWGVGCWGGGVCGLTDERFSINWAWPVSLRLLCAV